MASTTLFLSLSLLLLLSSSSLSSSSLPSSAILDAAEILSGSGYAAMALTLELASQTLTPEPRTHSLTLFAPSDAAFKNHPNLPLSLLRYHLLPHAFSLHSLTSLPFGAKIPTLLPSHFLTVTTTSRSGHRHRHRHLSINSVTVNPSPVYDDGSLIIFGTETFFDPYFQLPTRKTHHRVGTGTATTSAAAVCFSSDRKWFSSDEAFSFREASDVLRSRGCSLMASLLDLQFLGLKDRPQMTLFAPVDVGAKNLSDYSSIQLRNHLVPCKILWSDLVKMENGSLIRTYERGFTLNVTKSSTDDEMLSVNGVPVILPELYFSDWLVVHGLREVLSASKGRRGKIEQGSGDAEAPSSSIGFNHYGEENSAQHNHFSVFH